MLMTSFAHLSIPGGGIPLFFFSFRFLVFPLKRLLSMVCMSDTVLVCASLYHQIVLEKPGSHSVFATTEADAHQDLKDVF